MNTTDLMLAGLTGNLEMLKGHIADFTEPEMLVRPVPTANHTAWQLGHLCVSEGWMINQVSPGAIPSLPLGFADKFTKETAKVDDPKEFPSKADILAAFEATRAATIRWVKSLTPADLMKPGPEPMRHMTPTIGAMIALLPVHVAMHMGQIQVVRRKLGRPIMF